MKYELKNRITNTVLDVLYPQNIYCIACGKPIEIAAKTGRRMALCDDCSEMLLYDQPERCRRCGRIGEIQTNICRECMRREPLYDRGVTAVVYDRDIPQIVYGLKYGGKSYLAKNIAQIMSNVVDVLGFYDIILPVPMHESKKKKRGFCQAGLISQELGKMLEKPVSEGNLVRTGKTRVMSGLTPGERRKNIEGAFSVISPEEFQGKILLLIDDLLTTGSTADECARVLKAAGAKKVYLAAFASAPESRNKFQ